MRVTTLRVLRWWSPEPSILIQQPCLTCPVTHTYSTRTGVHKAFLFPHTSTKNTPSCTNSYFSSPTILYKLLSIFLLLSFSLVLRLYLSPADAHYCVHHANWLAPLKMIVIMRQLMISGLKKRMTIDFHSHRQWITVRHCAQKLRKLDKRTGPWLQPEMWASQ